MKHSASLQGFRPFVYVDSSDEEGGESPEGRGDVGWSGVHVGEEYGKIQDKEYKKSLKELVKKGIEKIQYGTALMIEPNDHQIHQNFLQRKEKYAYFLQQMQIDEKYQQKLNEKVAKLKEKNKQKEEVLKRKRQAEQKRDQQCMLIKYRIEKQGKQQKVINEAKKTIHQLQVERKVHITKSLTNKIKAQRFKTEIKLQNLRKKQKNELDQLRQLYQQIKISKKISRIDQQRALKGMQKMNNKYKGELQQKLIIRKDFAT